MIADGVDSTVPTMSQMPLVEVALVLYGEGVIPEDITSAIGMAPTKTWRLGDAIQKSALKHKHDGWEFSLPQRQTYDLDTFLRELLDIVEPHKERIAEVARELHLCAVISFGIYFKENEVPATWFAAETIQRVAALGADLDIDLNQTC